VGNLGKAYFLQNISSKRLDVNCAEKPCPYFYLLQADLVNSGASRAENIELAVGLFWKADGQQLVFPVGNQGLQAVEERVRPEGLSLSPGETQTLRIKVDRALPEVPGGEFVPNIRVLHGPVDSAPGSSEMGSDAKAQMDDKMKDMSEDKSMKDKSEMKAPGEVSEIDRPL